MKDLLKEVCDIMEEEILLTVEYTTEEVTIKVTKAGFKAVEPIEKEARGIEEESEETLFWSIGDDISIL